jgi:hypothetical protein
LRKPAPHPAAQPCWLFPTAVLLAAVFLLGLFSTEMADPDSWWHLATGRYIVQNRHLPTPDPFAYTTAKAAPANLAEEATRRFNLTHEWLSQAAWYAIYAAGGFPAVVLWKALLLALFCGLTGWVAARRARSGWWGLAAAALAIEFAHDRPALLTYVFTAAFLVIFESRRRLYLLPLLALVWANCHGGFFLGWIVCAAYALDALVRRAPDRRNILIAGAAAILASALNPNGFASVATVLRYRQSPLQASLIEWSRADLWGPPYAFDLLLYAAAISLVLSWRSVRLSDWLLFAAFAAAALMAFRNELLIGLLAPVLIASYAPMDWLKSRAARLVRAKPDARPLRALPYAAIALLAAATAWGAARGSFFQLRAAEWSYPAGAADFLLQHRISTPLFNTYEYGGYLIWRGLPVFIDGRALSESVFQDYRYILGTPPGDPRRDATLARYGVGAILVNSFEYNSGALYALVLALAQPGQSAWHLVYEDAQSLLFLRDVPPGIPVLDSRRLAAHLETECRLHIDHAPEFSLCARKLADLYMRAGDNESAKRALALYLAHPYADDPEARAAYLKLLGQ